MKISASETGEIKLQADTRFAIIAARFNHEIVDNLLTGALATFKEYAVDEKNIDVLKVPGAFELPLIAQHLADTNQYAAIITLGCVIRGDTPHFDYVAGECARGVMDVSLNSGVPVVFGVLTTDTVEQAQQRSDLQGDNKGVDCALCALEMTTTIDQIRENH